MAYELITRSEDSKQSRYFSSEGYAREQWAEARADERTSFALLVEVDYGTELALYELN